MQILAGYCIQNHSTQNAYIKLKLTDADFKLDWGVLGINHGG